MALQQYGSAVRLARQLLRAWPSLWVGPVCTACPPEGTLLPGTSSAVVAEGPGEVHRVKPLKQEAAACLWCGSVSYLCCAHGLREPAAGLTARARRTQWRGPTMEVSLELWETPLESQPWGWKNLRLESAGAASPARSISPSSQARLFPSCW